MRVFQNAFEAGRAYPMPVLAIGKFDAIHKGHQKLISQAVKRAKALRTGCLILTFDPLPDQHLRLFDYKPVLPMARRLEVLSDLGVDAVVIMPFDERLACLSPEGFAKNVLSLQLRPVDVFVGADFCFGKDRAGRVEDLVAFGSDLGFMVHAVPLVKAEGKKISASDIRKLIEKGENKRAEELLGRKLA
jgi:riboflavin kinase / FMN adenylyltransferase